MFTVSGWLETWKVVMRLFVKVLGMSGLISTDVIGLFTGGGAAPGLF